MSSIENINRRRKTEISSWCMLYGFAVVLSVFWFRVNLVNQQYHLDSPFFSGILIVLTSFGLWRRWSVIIPFTILGFGFLGVPLIWFVRESGNVPRQFEDYCIPVLGPLAGLFVGILYDIGFFDDEDEEDDATDDIRYRESERTFQETKQVDSERWRIDL